MSSKPLPTFSRLYLHTGLPASDSLRFRRRIGQCAYELLTGRVKDPGKAKRYLEQETGAEVRYVGADASSVKHFFIEAELPDVLDSITHLFRWFLAHQLRTANKFDEPYDIWLRFVRRAFAEQNLAYTLDDEGVVHYSVDQEFERAKQSTLAVLNSARYSSVRDEFQAAFSSLDSVPPDTKEAVRRIFDATEVMYKLVTGATGKSRLNGSGVERDLGPVLQSTVKGSVTASQSVASVLKSFAQWIEAVHWYRHGQGTTEPDPPPIHYALVLISSGTAFLRWLATADMGQVTGAVEKSQS